MKWRAKPVTETAVQVRRSIGYAVAVVQRKLRINLTPVLTPSRPLFGDVQHGKIEHLEQAVIGRENRLGLLSSSRISSRLASSSGVLFLPISFSSIRLVLLYTIYGVYTRFGMVS